jgi:NADP-dependent 3-hydroxy acid dehydrogenase YdfG
MFDKMIEIIIKSALRLVRVIVPKMIERSAAVHHQHRIRGRLAAANQPAHSFTRPD